MKKGALLVGIILLILNMTIFAATNGLSLTTEEKDWLADHPVIYYAPDPEYAPYEYIEDGEFKGIVSDYLAIFEDALGVTFEVVSHDSWSDVIEAAKSGRIDVIFATKTLDRSQYLIFTEPVIDYPNVIVSNNQINSEISEANLSDYSIGYMSGYAIEEYIHLLYPDADIVSYGSIEGGLKDVSTGKIDTFLGDIGQISYYASKMKITNLSIKSETAYHYSLRYGVTNNNEMLRNILQKTMAAMSDSRKENIQNKWIAIRDNRGLNDTQKLYLLFVILMAALVIAFISRWNQTLRKQVDQKTRALKRLNNELEEKVHQRTQSLEETNQELEVSIENLITTQEKLVDAQKNALLGELIVGVAHELNTPIGSSLTSISYLQEKTNELSLQLIRNNLSLKDVATFSDMMLQSSQSIINNLERVSTIIERFMSLESSQWGNHKEEINLGGLFSDIIEHIGEFDYRLMSYEVNCIDSGVIIESSSTWWYEILRGLMLNTLLHGYKGLEKGEIQIRLEQNSERVLVKYEDKGQGISEEDLNRVFDPFFTTSEDHEHIGLGLPIIKNLINKEMNGIMELESEKDKYTRIIITIPTIKKNDNV